MQQRGVSQETVETIVKYHSNKVHKGKGRVSLTITRKHAHQLFHNGNLSKVMAEKVCGLAVLVIPKRSGVAVVTVLHVHRETNSGYYRYKS